MKLIAGVCFFFAGVFITNFGSGSNSGQALCSAESDGESVKNGEVCQSALEWWIWSASTQWKLLGSYGGSA